MKEDKSEIIERFKVGLLHRNCSGQLTYEINEAWAHSYKKLRNLVRKQFGVLPLHPALRTPDEILQNHFKGTKIIGIEWDNWSGFMVVAQNRGAETLVRQIATFLELYYKT